MARVYYTSQNLVDEVRQQLDETNTDSVSDSSDILPALNRAQEYAFDIYSRVYPEPLLKHATLTLTDGQAEYDLPEDAFEDRILKVEITVPGNGLSSQIQVRQISYRDISEYESTTTVSIPTYYAIVGRKLRIVPTPNGVYQGRQWYIREPDRIVLPQGRITTINSGSNYINVDSIGTAVSSEADNLASYINIVDGQTGTIKSSMQIGSISGNRVNLRSSPARSTVLNQTISSSIDSTVALDDYICSVTGTCVPFYGSPTGNFMIQYAVSEITRKLGGQSALTEEQILQRFEKMVERNWAGREIHFRVTKANAVWGTSSVNRRIYPRTN